MLLVAAAVGAYRIVGPAMPNDQSIHVIVGDAASRVTELRLRYADANSSAEPSWLREVSFAFPGGAPTRVITHQPRLPDGKYALEIELTARNDRAVVKREVTLGGAGGAVSVDVSQAVP